MWPAQRYAMTVLATATAGTGIGLASAPSAVADCVYSGGATICSQGEVRGASGAPGPSGPYYPYPCEDDWMCGDGGVSVIVGGGGGGIGPPIDVGRPGRPGGGRG
jgi:hypothetical protein